MVRIEKNNLEFGDSVFKSSTYYNSITTRLWQVLQI